MEFHPDVYKRACSKLNAPPDAVKEAIEMIEQKRKPRKAVRNLLVTAAILALAVLAAMGANAASDGELFEEVLFFSVCKTTDESGEVKLSMDVAENGGEVKLSMDVAENGDALQNAQKFTITEDGEGKAYLTYTDENGIQVREELDLTEDKANDQSAPAGQENPEADAEQRAASDAG